MLAMTTWLEVVPNWPMIKAFFREFTLDMAWRYIAGFAFFSLFIISIYGLARYSDSLTTHYTVRVSFNIPKVLKPKLSLLMPIVVRTIEVIIERDGIHEWKNIITDHPVKFAGVVIFTLVLYFPFLTLNFQALIYWFVRVFTLTCCFHRKNRVVVQ